MKNGKIKRDDVISRFIGAKYRGDEEAPKDRPFKAVTIGTHGLSGLILRNEMAWNDFRKVYETNGGANMPFSYWEEKS